MSEPLISILVPTYNRAYCLPRTLDSALAQTHTNLEILVIDDGSTDNTRALLSEKYADEPRVRYAHQTNQGVSSARNRGLAMAQGDYIAFLDSDDLWDAWKLELQVACMEQTPDIGMVWTEMRAVGADGILTHERYLHTMYSAYRWFTKERLFPTRIPLHSAAPHLAAHVGEADFGTGDLYSPMIMGNLVHTSTVLLRKERADQVGLFDVRFHNVGEDYDYHLRTCRVGPVGYLDLPTITYQIGRPDNLSRSEFHLDVARNYLTVLTREWETERERITLPETMVAEAFVEAYTWLGYELLEHGQNAEARRMFLRSLRRNPRQPRTLKLLAAASLPGGMLRGMRRMTRRLKAGRLTASSEG